MKGILNCDGGSRGNPGPSAAGAVVVNEGGEVLGEVSEYLGTMTNNQAEYTAVILGLRMCLALDLDELEVRLDSELAVKQINGEYRVKNPDLAKLYLQVFEEKNKFKSIKFLHVRRERNKEADALVNRALDLKLK